MKKLKENKGITTIALVITIIILLILAGITILTLTGENGIIKKAIISREKTYEAQEDEKEKIATLEENIDELSSTKKTYSETILFEGETLTCTTYDLKEDISNYNYLYIQYEQMQNGVATNSSKSAEIIKVSNITKDNSRDLMHVAWYTDRIMYHFIDSKLVVDHIENNYPPIITQIIGIK